MFATLSQSLADTEALQVLVVVTYVLQNGTEVSDNLFK